MLSSSVKKKLMIWDKDDHFQLFTLASTPAQVTKTRWKQTRQRGALVNIFSHKHLTFQQKCHQLMFRYIDPRMRCIAWMEPDPQVNRQSYYLSSPLTGATHQR